MAALSHLPRTLRRAAVAVVLVTGCVASIATTAPYEDCSEAASQAEVSDFYGPQDDDSGQTSWTRPKELTAHGYTLKGVTVSVSGCVAESTTVPVYVRLDFAQDGTGGEPEDVFASFQVADATGRTWNALEPSIYEGTPATKARRADPASANLVFDLPLDVQEPVVLLLGDLATEDLDRLVLDPTDTGEEG